MKLILAALVASSVLTSAAFAGDKPIIAPAPSWVKPVPAVQDSDKPDDAPVRILLSDQQLALEPGKQSIYTEVALKVQTPQGLAAGNISFPWRPDSDTLTVHKLLIRRGGKVIDVLASGQTFTVVRREQNLENATLDGILTANIQPEGIQVGDIVEFAASITSSDPVMKDHIEQIAAAWNGFRVAHAHLRIQWPSTMRVRLRQAGRLPALKPVKAGGLTTVEAMIDNLEPLVAPKGAPPRFAMGRFVEVSDFASWAELGALMAPLYEKAATVAPTGTLRAELERIKGASSDPRTRAEAALALVQDRVRYVALMMGVGGYLPADAELTWSRRYGDCKGKTALLLALLHGLDIAAEPVAVSTELGDGLDQRLPMAGAFNHVLVRATIAGRTYWLDGTRTGDTSLDRLQTPAFVWGLPLVAANAALIAMVPTPPAAPLEDVAIHIDASAGLTIPAPTRVETVYRGDQALATNAVLAGLVGDARDRALRDYWKGQYDFIDVKSASATFDAKTGEERLVMDGTARMDWSSGWYETDGTGVGYKADFSRDPGAGSDAPFAVAFPNYSRVTEKIILPDGFSGADIDSKANVDQTVAGVEYHRRASLAANVFTIEKTERSVAREFPASEAASAQAALRDLAGRTVYIRKAAGYVRTIREADALLAQTPTTADDYVRRGNLLLDRQRYDESIKDFERAAALDPKNGLAFANMGIAYVWKGDFALGQKNLDAAAALDPRNAVVFRARGLMAQMRDAPKEAITAYTTALDIEPGSGFALGHRAEANRAAGNDDAALRDAEAALRLSPRWTSLYLLRANIFRSQGKAEEGLKEAAALEANNAGDAYAHVAAANVFHAFRKDAEALAAFDRALAIKPEPYIYLNRSLSRPRADVAARRADVDAALKLDPNFAEAIVAKAQMQADGGDNAGALALYASAVEKSPDDPSLLVGRGIAYARAGKAALAEKDFAAARAKTSDATALNNMCWAKATAGVALESALADCNAALTKAPEIPGFLDSRGLVMLRLGRLDDALADYSRALAKSGSLSSSLFGRAVVWSRKGDKAKSEADIAAALKVDPDVQTRFEGYGVRP